MRSSRIVSFVTVLSMLVPMAASALSFPDVPSTHPFKAQIDALVEMEVVAGNPDGTFRPHHPVNRAALLKMLYIAAGKTPDTALKGCFRADVPADAWFAPYVCDAVFRGYVKGYPDGTFRPGNPVTRAEALKLSLAVFGISVQGAASTQYTDVPSNEWYAGLVTTAVSVGILPISGQEGPLFVPHEPLKRAEAAAYIWNALQASDGEVTAPPVSSAPSSAAGEVSSRKQVEVDDGSSADVTNGVLPINVTHQLQKKERASFRFSVKEKTTLDARAVMEEGSLGTVRCTLYRLDASGLSTEYYIGLVDGVECRILAGVSPGDYQLDLSPGPTVASNSRVKVSVTPGAKGDNNDGLSQAKKVVAKVLTVDVFDPNDLQDWFVFTVDKEKSLTLAVTSESKVSCLIYPSKEVDLLGFGGPQCGQAYTYPAGTYYVSVGRALPRSTKQTFTVDLR